jgi:predicted RNA-binding protein with PUA-like domain
MKNRQYWLLKSEGSAYSIDDLRRDTKTAWTGVRNYQARNFLKAMHAGDLCLYYHSGTEPAVCGIARVVSEPYPDPTQFEKGGHYFDEKSTKENPRWTLVDVAFVKKFKEPISLAEIKNDPALEGMLLRAATRLSVQPVSEKHYLHIAEKLAA